MKKSVISVISIVAVGMLVLAGCSSTSPEMGSYEKQLSMKNKEIKELSASNMDKAKAIESYRMQLDKEAAAKAEAERRYNEAMASSGKSTDSNLFPPNAKPGECWARTFVAPTYRTVTETVLKRGESERVELAPAKYEFVEERVLVREASSRMEIIPAQYEWTEERVMVQAPGANLIEIPAKYEWQEERVLVKPAHTAWKKGRGPIERIDNSTGEIMCLVEVPASYETVRKRVMTSPPASKEIAVPAKYQTVKKRVMTKPPQQRTIEIPAEYKTVKVRRMVTPPSENRIKIPAEYGEVTRTEKVTEGHMEWRRILCETNVDAGTISRVQQALLNAGHNPGPIDGVIGWKTNAAIKSFQRQNNLAVGELTYETMNKLGINL